MTAPVIAEIERIGIVPVVVLDDASHGRDIARALQDGGVACAEFALRTPAALGALEAAAGVEGFFAGAGTVLTEEQADAAASAGASFAVTPGYDGVIVARLASRGVPLIPGIATPTEAMRARADGHTHVKVFPAGNLGGPAYLDALNGPLPDLRFLPSGGVSRDTLADYLARPHVFAASGSWMVPRAAIARGDFATIAAAARECADIRDTVRGPR